MRKHWIAIGAVALVALIAMPGMASAAQTCSQAQPVAGSSTVQLANGVSVVKPPSSVPAGTQLVVGARYLASARYKSVYAFISATRTGSAIGEQFFSGSGSKMRCARIGGKLQAGSTRYIQYQLVPKKQGGKRTKVFYKITVQS